MEGSDSVLARTSERFPEAQGDPSTPPWGMWEGHSARLRQPGEVIPEDSVKAAGAFQEDSPEGFVEVVWVTEDHHSADFMGAASLTAAISHMVASGAIDESRHSAEAII